MKGTTVGGRFRLEERLGEGGMGIVWEATNLRTHRVVALKILKAETPQQRRRLFREGKIAGRLRHPNIVDVHDVVELDDGTPAIVMERLRGESLRALLGREPKLPPSRVAQLFTPIARALECAHRQGIVHRDLKPDNVFLADGAVVKVLDFGIARLTSAEDAAAATAAFTDTGDVIGTPAYMAPEQVFGEKDVDTRVDVWSFGVMLFECLSGRKPFVGENFGQIWKAVAMGEITSLAVLAPELPADLSSLVMKMLARDRAERPTDWNAIIAVLEGDAPPPRRARRWIAPLLIASAAGMVSVVALRLSSTTAPVPVVIAEDAAPAPLVSAAPAVPVAAPTQSAPKIEAAPTPPPMRARPSASIADPVLPGGVHAKSPY